MRRKIITGVIIGILMLFIALAVILQEDAALDVAISAKNEIGVIDITGVIVSGNSGSDFMGGTFTGSASVIDQLRRVRENPNMPAVILYMNSPGGSPAASLEIGNKIKRLREEGKIVVTYMADIATSGAYWIACETDLIVANPSTMTGSIGVIMQIFNFEELYDMLGIDVNVIKSGEHKDMGATHRDVIEEEKRIFQSMVNDIYEQFIEVVSKGRNMEIEQVKKLADGRVYTGRQALELGLVDKLGDMRDAIEVAADLAGIEGAPYIVNLTPVSFWDEFFGHISLGNVFPYDIYVENYIGPMLLPPHVVKPHVVNNKSQSL